MQRDESYISDIVIAARMIAEYIEGYSLEEFLDDPRTQDAVIRQILLIGEAVKQISEDFRAAHATVPWRDIAGMRDVLIHNYRGISLPIVWKAASIEIPAIRQSVEPMLPSHDPEL